MDRRGLQASIIGTGQAQQFKLAACRKNSCRWRKGAHNTVLVGFRRWSGSDPDHGCAQSGTRSIRKLRNWLASKKALPAKPVD